MTEDKILRINRRSFITVCTILITILLITYIATFYVPKGFYEEDTNVFIPIEGLGYPFWKFILAPFRLLLSMEHAPFIIVISLFIVVIGGAFNVIDKTKGIGSILAFLIKRYQNKKYKLLYIVTLFFMLFGSLFGIFEESVTLLPIIVLLALSLGWDTFTGLGMCVLAACFGFSTAMTNPFSVGLASSKMGITVIDGLWYRALIFILMYIILCIFLTIHVKKIEKDPTKSPTYESDQERKKNLNTEDLFKDYNPKILKIYAIFFGFNLLLIIVSTLIPFVRDNGLSLPLLTLSFLIGIFIAGKAIGYSFKNIGKMFLSGLKSMSPAIIMIMLAASIKFLLSDAQIMDTMIEFLTNMFSNQRGLLGILFIYAVILVIEFFVGSASAKVMLVIPIISILATNIGISQNLALLAFLFGDGYSDSIYPTNPVLIIALGMVSFSYIKWFKKTIVLQLFILALTVLLLIIGFYIGY